MITECNHTTAKICPKCAEENSHGQLQADLRKLVETMRSASSAFGEGFAEGYSEASRDWADELEAVLNKEGE